MMTPLRCEERGGDQERVRLRELLEANKLRGGALGTVCILITYYELFCVILQSTHYLEQLSH